jgi:DNA-binding winged helix-turn-helix (wHTH) protein
MVRWELKVEKGKNYQIPKIWSSSISTSLSLTRIIAKVNGAFQGVYSALNAVTGTIKKSGIMVPRYNTYHRPRGLLCLT